MTEEEIKKKIYEGLGIGGKLDFSRDNLDSNMIIYLAKELEKNTKLVELGLRYNKIGDQGAQAIANALKKNTSLKRLDLYNINIGVKGAKAIAEALEENKVLEELDLRFNNIGNKGAVAIGNALLKNKSLKTLKLSVNNFTDESFIVFLKALQINTSLQELDLSSNAPKNNENNNVNSELKKALITNKTLKRLNLSGIGITPDYAKAIADGLKENTKAAQDALLLRARANGLATLGKYTNEEDVGKSLHESNYVY